MNDLEKIEHIWEKYFLGGNPMSYRDSIDIYQSYSEFGAEIIMEAMRQVFRQMQKGSTACISSFSYIRRVAEGIKNHKQRTPGVMSHDEFKTETEQKEERLSREKRFETLKRMRMAKGYLAGTFRGWMEENHRGPYFAVIHWVKVGGEAPKALEEWKRLWKYFEENLMNQETDDFKEFVDL